MWMTIQCSCGCAALIVLQWLNPDMHLSVLLLFACMHGQAEEKDHTCVDPTKVGTSENQLEKSYTLAS